MKYLVTIQFSVEDDENFAIEKAIATEGLKAVEEQFALGFSDPEFHNVNCTVRVKE